MANEEQSSKPKDAFLPQSFRIYGGKHGEVSHGRAWRGEEDEALVLLLAVEASNTGPMGAL